jgi:hypothetical protein
MDTECMMPKFNSLVWLSLWRLHLITMAFVFLFFGIYTYPEYILIYFVPCLA